MDPVLTRLGDVTIQRLEKPKDPKVGPQNDGGSLDKAGDNKDENYSEPEDESGDEMSTPNLKRPMPVPQNNSKKFKFSSGDLSLQKKLDELGSFSETEMSDYDSDSEMDESESELNDLSSHEVLNNLLKPPVVAKEAEKEASEEEDNNESFFEKLVEQVEVPTPTTSNNSKPSDASADEDYDIDIKEKLKEMGEISFETVKKGEKPVKKEVAAENEVVVTPAKRFGKKTCLYTYF